MIKRKTFFASVLVTAILIAVIQGIGFSTQSDSVLWERLDNNNPSLNSWVLENENLGDMVLYIESSPADYLVLVEDKIVYQGKRSVSPAIADFRSYKANRIIVQSTEIIPDISNSFFLITESNAKLRFGYGYGLVFFVLSYIILNSVTFIVIGKLKNGTIDGTWQYLAIPGLALLAPGIALVAKLVYGDYFEGFIDEYSIITLIAFSVFSIFIYNPKQSLISAIKNEISAKIILFCALSGVVASLMELEYFYWTFVLIIVYSFSHGLVFSKYESYFSLFEKIVMMIAIYLIVLNESAVFKGSVTYWGAFQGIFIMRMVVEWKIVSNLLKENKQKEKYSSILKKEIIDLGRANKHNERIADISSRKMKAVLNEISDGIAIFDLRNKRMLESNEPLSTILGVEREAIEKYPTLQALNSFWRAGSKLDWRHKDRGWEYFRARNGKYIGYFTTEIPDTGLLAIYRDLSDSWEMETKSKELLQKEKAKGKSRTEWVAKLAHEIKSPLFAISASIDSILTSNNPNEIKSVAANMDNVVDSILAQTDSVLDFSSADRENIEINTRIACPGEVIENAFRASIIKCRDKGLKPCLDISEDCYKNYVFDDRKLLKITGNIAWNAVKYTRDGYVKITSFVKNDELIVRVLDSGIGVDEDKVEELFEKYSQGENANAANREFGGTGLGLPIARGMARAMGGDIKAMSNPEGQGACFEIRLYIGVSSSENYEFLKGKNVAVLATGERKKELTRIFRPDTVVMFAENEEELESYDVMSPDIYFIDPFLLDKNENRNWKDSYKMIFWLEDAPEGETEFPIIHQPFTRHEIKNLDEKHQLSNSAILSRSTRILLVEDDSLVRESICRYLINNGWEDITIARNGLDGAKLIKENEFDVILTDYHMPELNGFDMIKEVRESIWKGHTIHNISTPYVMMTADAETGVVKKCREAGIEFFLPKPSRMHALEAMILQATGKLSFIESSFVDEIDETEFDRELLVEMGVENIRDTALSALEEFQANITNLSNGIVKEGSSIFEETHQIKNRIAFRGFVSLARIAGEVSAYAHSHDDKETVREINRRMPDILHVIKKNEQMARLLD